MNTESLPNLIIYVPSRDVYTTLVGTFDTESINSFISKALQGKNSLYNISKDQMKLKDIKCEDIKEINESEEDDEILREIIEAEQKKRKEFEVERDGEKKGKKKKKKKDL